MKQHRRTHRSHSKDPASPCDGEDQKWPACSAHDRRASSQFESDTDDFSSGRSHTSPGEERPGVS
jgi:hypothetical protein